MTTSVSANCRDRRRARRCDLFGQRRERAGIQDRLHHRSVRPARRLLYADMGGLRPLHEGAQRPRRRQRPQGQGLARRRRPARRPRDRGREEAGRARRRARHLRPEPEQHARSGDRRDAQGRRAGRHQLLGGARRAAARQVALLQHRRAVRGGRRGDRHADAAHRAEGQGRRRDVRQRRRPCRAAPQQADGREERPRLGRGDLSRCAPPISRRSPRPSRRRSRTSWSGTTAPSRTSAWSRHCAPPAIPAPTSSRPTAHRRRP